MATTLDGKPLRIVLNYCAWDSVKSSTCFQLCQLVASGLISSIVSSSGTLLPMARNEAFLGCCKVDPDFTHILTIDSDVSGVTAELVQKLIEANVDIISPVTTMRCPPFTPHLWPDEIRLLAEQLEKKSEQREIIKVKGVGFGCCLVKREVVMATLEKAPDGTGISWFNSDRLPRNSFPDECSTELDRLIERFSEAKLDLEEIIKHAFLKGVAMGTNASVGAGTFGEDFAFCLRAAKLGFQTWLATNLFLGHIGDCTYDIQDWYEWETRTTELTNRTEKKVSIWRKAESAPLLKLS